MRTNQLHQVIINESDMIDVFYRDEHVGPIIVDDPQWVKRLNRSLSDYGITVLQWEEESELDPDEFILKNRNEWHMPAEYAEIDIENYLLSKCDTDDQRERVNMELAEYNQRDMIVVLQWLKYFVDTMRENGLVWGVGRGSSVASYVLFLLDVHRVDSLAYELDIKEFLK